jgi:hypothetical protein
MAALKEKSLAGKYNYMSSANKNEQQNITVEPLLKHHKKTTHLFINRSLRSCTCKAGLKTMPSFVCKDKCLPKRYVF